MNTITINIINYKRKIKNYIIGFIASVILTLIPFGLVFSDIVSKKYTLIVIILSAIIQIIVHLIYFLHINTNKANQWNLLALIFTLIIITIIISGSIWIMHNLHLNMMLN
uniref:Cytochrome bo(3) ubiquinol oxidase subunit 4 n=1 Tax=Candidatus Aschnera chinzeii TaxID=1485666 RepID=A0AAT9G3R4_9ENTR|nr:MAG: cytochrome o ubiquinol oxidase subunit IV [Candidatus Aschnera chinzeii]